MPDAPAPARLTLGGDLAVNRLGFGAMRITSPGIWGPPADEAAAIALLRRVVERGVNFIDTADSYGPGVSERLIAEALHPYPSGLVIATKGGLLRPGPDRWVADCRPEHLRQACEDSLKRLRLDRIDLYQLHAVDHRVPIEESVGALRELQRQGKIRHLGVSNVSGPELARARQAVDIVSVQNHYNLTDRSVGHPGRCLRRGRHRVHPMVPARRRPADAPRVGAGPDRRAASRNPGADRTRLAIAPLADDVADPRHHLDRAFRREPRRCRDPPRRRRTAPTGALTRLARLDQSLLSAAAARAGFLGVGGGGWLVPIAAASAGSGPSSGCSCGASALSSCTAKALVKWYCAATAPGT
jgi:aryl-alcohol dehydrogenase-like predicted oxidoreductase